MKTFLVAASGVLFSAVSIAPAHSQSIVQSNAINVAAVVSIGGLPASVTQVGKYNYAGVVQTGTAPYAVLTQHGQAVNAGFISQSGANTAAFINQSGGPRVNNGAAIGQSPWGYRR